MNAAADGLQRRMEMMERMQQQELQVKENRWADSTKVEAARRRNRIGIKKGESIKMHLAQRISMEHREEIHEKIRRKVRHLLWD